ncbi:extensin family protein [Pseudooceanicola marinus]|uniref:extensin-like domain-containing protein n=1 Tax=Pseudooceanicola marinus TaxID=396013 RepID=UPI001CD49E84|nr:extensin family protein [Pseudooceanicola marinus]MCA1336522.1 extensin family protein [Pseudooceanicola marinus]
MIRRAARIAAACLAGTLLAGGPGAAELAPDASLRPVARGQVVRGMVLPAEIFVQRDIAHEVALQALSAARDPGRAETLGVTRRLPDPDTAPRVALRPHLRPATVVQQGRRVAALRQQGAVCGDLALQGVAIGRVPSDTSGCGVDQAVRLQSVSGVALSTHAVMDCGTAQALKSWVEGGLRPAVKRYGGGVRELRVVAHYACRPRNNRKGARISEHGKGRAVDIAAIELNDGKELVVLDDWSNGREGRILKAAHASACGPFGTVLGPEANALHRDHFHFDTARYRSGSYCR